MTWINLCSSIDSRTPNSKLGVVIYGQPQVVPCSTILNTVGKIPLEEKTAGSILGEFYKNMSELVFNEDFNVLDESRSFFRVHTGYFSNIPKCIKAEFIASWACSQSSVVSSSKR
ncbi:hypothetical protein TNCV_2085581 [Trichonephila clavipes]|nr:hypothetical protein TNCV_2085581 [Trichonephila clavipes]